MGNNMIPKIGDIWSYTSDTGYVTHYMFLNRQEYGWWNVYALEKGLATQISFFNYAKRWTKVSHSPDN
jgi:hypothetical protein